MITTQRLTLREWIDSDIETFVLINQDPHVIEFLPGALTRTQTLAFVDRIKLHFKQNGYGLWAVSLNETGEFIGFVGLSIPSFSSHFTPCVEVGWRLSSQYWGNGYATEAAQKAIETGFSQFNLKEIVSFTTEKNIRSIRVMEKIAMKRNSDDDFLHPNLATNHPLSKHVLYRIQLSSIQRDHL